MPPDRERIALVATSIPIAVVRAYERRGPGRLRRLVAIHSPTLAIPPREPAKNPANPPLKGPALTMDPATNPAMKGPISGMPTASMRLMRNPTPIASRRSAVASRVGSVGFFGMDCSAQIAGKVFSGHVIFYA